MSVEVWERDPQLPGEGPRVITRQNVIFWCEHTLELRGTVRGKMFNFIDFDCVQYAGGGRFVVLPLNGQEEVLWQDPDGFEVSTFHKKPAPFNYNNTVHLLRKLDNGGFSCTCFGWRLREKKGALNDGHANCAHEGALFLAFKMRLFGHDGSREVPTFYGGD